MDLRTSFHAVGWLEPAFLASIAAGILAAYVAHRAMPYFATIVSRPGRRKILLPLIWLGTVLFLFVGPQVLLGVLYSLTHPLAFACTVVVGWAYCVPPLIFAVLTARRALGHSAER